MFKKDYKFYLAFENSNCKEYITEKLFENSYEYNMLPIVMGARPEEYKKYTPDNSFIHIEEFPSPKELAEYLHKLDQDDDLYNSYFKWKGTTKYLQLIWAILITHAYLFRLCTRNWGVSSVFLSTILSPVRNAA